MNKLKKNIKKKKINYFRVMLYVGLYSSFILVGFIMGMFYQQMIMIKGVGYILSYSDLEVNVNFNATKFVNEINRTFIPEFNKELNNTIQKLCIKTQKGFCAKECYENGNRIPCEEFEGDEHFCFHGVCQMNGVCPDYYDKLNNKTIADCVAEIEYNYSRFENG